MRFTAAEGADRHCERLARSLFEQRALDWLDETLALTPGGLRHEGGNAIDGAHRARTDTAARTAEPEDLIVGTRLPTCGAMGTKVVERLVAQNPAFAGLSIREYDGLDVRLTTGRPVKFLRQQRRAGWLQRHHRGVERGRDQR